MEAKRQKINTLQDLRESKEAAITLSDGAALFKCDARTVKRAVENGSIPSIRVGHRIYIPREPLLALLGADVPVSA